MRYPRRPSRQASAKTYAILCGIFVFSGLVLWTLAGGEEWIWELLCVVGLIISYARYRRMRQRGPDGANPIG